jgi:hypothetical protein
VSSNKGDTQLSVARYHIATATQLLHELVGSRDIELAIACCKLAVYLTERCRDHERAKRHHSARDSLIEVQEDADAEAALFKEPKT